MDLPDHALQELLDKQAIHEVLMRYCRGVDRCDEELIRTAYHPDGVDEHGIYASNGWEFARTIVAAKLDETQWCRHDIANHLIELDGEVALSEATFMSYQQKVGEVAVQVLAGRYVDRFERREGTWRIARRLVVHDWSGSLTLGPWTLDTVPPEQFTQGGRGDDDVVTGPGRARLLG